MSGWVKKRRSDPRGYFFSCNVIFGTLCHQDVSLRRTVPAVAQPPAFHPGQFAPAVPNRLPKPPPRPPEWIPTPLHRTIQDRKKLGPLRPGAAATTTSLHSKKTRPTRHAILPSFFSRFRSKPRPALLRQRLAPRHHRLVRQFRQRHPTASTASCRARSSAQRKRRQETTGGHRFP
ncbi:MAG: hypothetical protein RLZZ179_3070 [Verrucomicrobiota bacterium]